MNGWNIYSIKSFLFRKIIFQFYIWLWMEDYHSQRFYDAASLSTLVAHFIIMEKILVKPVVLTIDTKP